MKFKEIPTTDRPEWLQWRHYGIGSSDAAVIMGVSRFCTKEELLKQKVSPFTGEDKTNDYIKDRGNKIETFVRTYLESTLRESLQPVSVESISSPFLKATLDGATTSRKIITEIKLLSSMDKDRINESTPGFQKWLAAKKGYVPVEYMPQIQHQLFITGAEVCIFAGYRELRGAEPIMSDNTALVFVEPDKQFMLNLLDKEFRFWYDVESAKFDAARHMNNLQIGVVNE